MFLPPEGVPGADLLSAPIARLCLAHPLNGVLTPKRQQWVADPATPLFEAAKRLARHDVVCNSTPAPDREERCQQLGAVRPHLSPNVGLEGACFGVLGTRVELHHNEAA